MAQPPTTASSGDEAKKPAKRKERAETKRDNQPSTDQAQRSCPNYSANEIPALLNRADKEKGAGQYGDAIHAYDVVLCLDPGNVRARQGRHSAKLSMGEQD
jgi:hypothetical protein